MPIEIRAAQPTICVRRQAFESAGFTRAAMDERLGLTPEEFRVEGDLIVIGPLFGDAAPRLLGELEAAGLEYFDDYFEMSGNWPNWLGMYVMHSR